MDIKLVREVDQYMVSNSIIQTLDLGEMELLRRLLYKAISLKPDKVTLKKILRHCTRVFRGRKSFTQDLAAFSSRTFDLILAAASKTEPKLY